MKRRLLLLLPLLFAGALAFLFLWMEASSQGWGGTYYEFDCPSPPPESLSRQAGCDGAWSRVEWVMQNSGCPSGAGDCWTNWIVQTNPHAWYECGAARTGPLGKSREALAGTPPAGFSPYTVDDPRAWCQDENCVKQWAAGTWYLNAVARPFFPSQPSYEHGMWVYRCEWKIPRDATYHWFFGESGNCYDCDCAVPPTQTPAPSPTAGPSPTPLPTECVPGTPTPPGPTTPPADPTPPPPPPVPTLAAQAWVRPPVGNRPPSVPSEGDWTQIQDRLYWLWQLQLYIRPWARATVGSGGGCSASAEVVGYYPMRIGPDGWSDEERRVCPDPLAHNPPTPSPKNSLYSSEGWEAFCRWRKVDEPLRLLWSRFPMEPKKEGEKEASLNQYEVTPWTQDWVKIDYKVMVRVDYTCGGDPMVGFYYGDLSIRVKLWKPVRVPLR